MKLKTIAIEGVEHGVIQDGKPVYINDDGKETTYDPVAMHTTISRLNNESKTHREAKETLEEAAKAFKDLDPVAAQKALDVVKNLDDKKLIDAGEVERVIGEKTAAFKKELEASKEETETLRSQYNTGKINTAFASSDYIKEKLAVPSDMAQATFGKHFIFKEDVMTPVDINGAVIYSDSNPGDIATFDEAMEKVVKTYAHRDSILKGSGHNGSGAETPGEGGKRSVTRKQFEGMSALEQQKIATSADVKITD